MARGSSVTEIAIGGVLLTPFIGQVVAALLLLLLLRPILHAIGFGRIVALPALGEFSLYVLILGLLVSLA